MAIELQKLVRCVENAITQEDCNWLPLSARGPDDKYTASDAMNDMLSNALICGCVRDAHSNKQFFHINCDGGPDDVQTMVHVTQAENKKGGFACRVERGLIADSKVQEISMADAAAPRLSITCSSRCCWPTRVGSSVSATATTSVAPTPRLASTRSVPPRRSSASKRQDRAPAVKIKSRSTSDRNSWSCLLSSLRPSLQSR